MPKKSHKLTIKVRARRTLSEEQTVEVPVDGRLSEELQKQTALDLVPRFVKVRGWKIKGGSPAPEFTVVEAPLK